jgi:hypothetical protein
MKGAKNMLTMKGKVLGIKQTSYQDKVYNKLKMLVDMDSYEVSIPEHKLNEVKNIQTGKDMGIKVEVLSYRDRPGFRYRYAGIQA